MRWSPQLRVTTKSPGPSSGKTWGRSCTRSAPWSSRYTFVSHVAGDVWFCFVFSLPYWSSTPLKDFVPFMYRSGSCQGWWSKDQRRLRPTVGGHAECFPNLGGVSFLPLSLSLRYPDPSAVQHSKDWLAHVLNVCHSHIVFFFFLLDVYAQTFHDLHKLYFILLIFNKFTHKKKQYWNPLRLSQNIT